MINHKSLAAHSKIKTQSIGNTNFAHMSKYIARLALVSSAYGFTININIQRII